MARFVVDLGDHPLTGEQHHAMASAIHGAVLSQIATHPVTAGTPAMASVATIDGMMRRTAPGSNLEAAHAELTRAAGG